MKIISDAESVGMKVLVFVLAITLIVITFIRVPKCTEDPQYYVPEQPTMSIDTVVIHDTVVEVHPITQYKTIYDTVYITK